jgi:putative transposase
LLKPLSFKRHHYLSDVIRDAVWLYYRSTRSLQDVEELPAERDVEVSHETIRCWCQKFGSQIARNLPKLRFSSARAWHLDEMFVSVGGKPM